MNKKLFIRSIGLIPLFILVFSFVKAQESHSDLKVMTYNIWNGFDWGKDNERRKELIRWVKEKNPDVLALQELCEYDEEKLKTDAAKWGHDYVKILKTEGYPTGLTSKKPIKLNEKVMDEMWHGLLHCTTFGIDFFVVHLSPADCNFRFREANIVKERVKNCKNEKYIILGDFNANSPFDESWLKSQNGLIEKYSKKRSDNYTNLRLGEIDYTVVSTFISIPTIDVANKFIAVDNRYTFPSPILVKAKGMEMESVIKTRERKDYILTSPKLSKSCKKVTIFNIGKTEYLSDHFPVMAVFNFLE